MPSWKHYRNQTVDDVEMVIEERTDLRNHLGSMEYYVAAKIGGEGVYSERVSQSVWEGHCCGRLYLPIIAERAKRAHARIQGVQ